MKTARRLLIPLLAATFSGCGLIYTDVKLPRGYRSSTPSEVKAAPGDPSVTGKACSHSILYLVAWGDTSYDKALKNALNGTDGILYDVRADLKVTGYLLGVYTEECTILSGKVAKP